MLFVILSLRILNSCVVVLENAFPRGGYPFSVCYAAVGFSLVSLYSAIIPVNNKLLLRTEIFSPRVASRRIHYLGIDIVYCIGVRQLRVFSNSMVCNLFLRLTHGVSFRLLSDNSQRIISCLPIRHLE